jgi:hypothetical protein
MSAEERASNEQDWALHEEYLHGTMVHKRSAVAGVLLAVLIIAYGVLGLVWRSDLCGDPIGSPPKTCYVEPSCLTRGLISVKVRSGYEISSVVLRHGYTATRTFDPPFDEIDRSNGMDRWFHVTVPVGSEVQEAHTYSRDPRVEHAETLGGCVYGL